jgi:hypothetical protein
MLLRRAGLKRVGTVQRVKWQCAGRERLKHFALGHGGDGCSIVLRADQPRQTGACGRAVTSV